MENHKIKINFLATRGRRKRLIKLVSIPCLFLILVENCLYYDAPHDFLVWLRTGSNPADNNQVRSNTDKGFLEFSIIV